MAAIETSGLTKVYGEDVVAVDGLDLTVEDGEIYGFLGPNGAGKSTTINLLLDFARPTSGSATVLGHDPREDAQAIRRRIGVLPEGASLYERLTGREHLRWIARANDVAPDAEELLATVGLTPTEADRVVGGYSKGMRQRLLFAMALVGDPELLILDEPSTGLDPSGMQEMRDIIREQAADGTTVFFSSHILGEVESVCDRLGIMNQGELVAVGSQEELTEELDLEGSISFEVAAAPDPDAIESLSGVRSVDVGDDTVTARVADPSHKVDVVRRVDERTEVLDVVSEDTSLEQLFNTYTDRGPDRGRGGDGADSQADDAPASADADGAVAEVSR